MRISAIIVALDEQERLPRILEDLRDADVHEVIVVDGGSTDDTVEIARSFDSFVVEGGRGRAFQMNLGAQAATGDVLWFLHADVRLPATAIEQMAEALADPGVVGGAFATHTVSDIGPHPLEVFLPLADVRSRYTWHPYGDQGIFVRRQVFDRCGGVPMQPLLEDLAFSRRLTNMGRLARLTGPMRVSGRRFLARPFYFSAVMNVFPVLYRAGVSPETLSRWYHRVR